VPYNWYTFSYQRTCDLHGNEPPSHRPIVQLTPRYLSGLRRNAPGFLSDALLTESDFENNAMSCALLLVEDHPLSRRSLAQALQLAAHTVLEADSGKIAVDLIARQHFDVVISDLRLPGLIDGLDVLRRQKEKSPGTRLILITAFGSAQTQTEVEALGAVYIEKPFSLQELLSAI
jgi:two-component system response regulator (stage 0 sporulation protein F)